MKKDIEIKNSNSKYVKGTFKKIDKKYLEDIILLQEKVMKGIEDKSIYIETTREEISYIFKNAGMAIGCFTSKDELIAVGLLANFMLDSSNYGYDIGLKDEELLKNGQIEFIIVDKNYIGNGLQNIILEEIEKIGKVKGLKSLSATVSPDNKYSLSNFLSLNYKIKKEKIKYNGFKRYILYKKL